MGLPCFKALDCWFMYFDVVGFLQQELTETEWQETFAKEPTPKIVSLAELIEKAQRQAKERKEKGE